MGCEGRAPSETLFSKSSNETSTEAPHVQKLAGITAEPTVRGPKNTRPIHKHQQPQLEALEDRLAPAILTESGTTLTIDLSNDGEKVIVSDQTTRYQLRSANGWVNNVSPSRVSTSNFIATIRPAGLAAYDTIRIIDSAQDTRVEFTNSSPGSFNWQDNFTIEMNADTAGSNTEPAVIFSGAHDFGTNDLSITSTRAVQLAGKAAVRSSDGDISMDVTRRARQRVRSQASRSGAAQQSSPRAAEPSRWQGAGATLPQMGYSVSYSAPERR